MKQSRWYLPLSCPSEDDTACFSIGKLQRRHYGMIMSHEGQKPYNLSYLRQVHVLPAFVTQHASTILHADPSLILDILGTPYARQQRLLTVPSQPTCSRLLGRSIIPRLVRRATISTRDRDSSSNDSCSLCGRIALHVRCQGTNRWFRRTCVCGGRG